MHELNDRNFSADNDEDDDNDDNNGSDDDGTATTMKTYYDNNYKTMTTTTTTTTTTTMTTMTTTMTTMTTRGGGVTRGDATTSRIRGAVTIIWYFGTYLRYLSTIVHRYLSLMKPPHKGTHIPK